MYRIKQAVIVEGRYDKIKLSGFLDGVILATGGFSVYRSNAILATVKRLAETTGIVILTDSDSAGFRIRNYVKQAITKGEVLHAYVPDIKGKEKRKAKPGKEGLLGVEGMSENVILDALRKAGCEIDGSAEEKKQAKAVTKADFMRLGLSGGGDSAKLRAELARELGLPMKMSANMLLDMVNRLLGLEELEELVEDIKRG